MKNIFVFPLLLACLCLPAFSQLPESYATAGLFYNTYTTPRVTGFGAYAKALSPTAYSYTVMDVTSRSLKDFKPETTTTTGIAQFLKKFGEVNIFALVTVGVTAAGNSSNTGTDVGFAGSGGFLLVKSINSGWSINVPIRVLATTLGPPQYVVGLGIGWGK